MEVEVEGKNTAIRVNSIIVLIVDCLCDTHILFMEASECISLDICHLVPLQLSDKTHCLPHGTKGLRQVITFGAMVMTSNMIHQKTGFDRINISSVGKTMNPIHVWICTWRRW